MQFSSFSNFDSGFPISRAHLATPVLLALSSVLVGVVCTIVLRPIIANLNELEVELSGLATFIIDQQRFLPLLVIPSFLLAVVMIFSIRLRWLLIVAATFILAVPVAAIIYLFLTMMGVLYGVRGEF